MRKAILLAFCIYYCSCFFSQATYSRDFEARKKNVPLAIINNHANYFLLLRYNKAAHDITIERRANPGAEIISFTPLKLDSVNADWFDYEKLDHLFFEKEHYFYFLFEKVLNSKKTLYLKIVDTLGKASGFIELAAVEKDKGVTDINLEYKTTANNNILIIASKTYGEFGVKKTATLFDVEKRKIVWTKKLPPENVNYGYSTTFECNETNDLFCVLTKIHVASFKRKYMNHAQMIIPVLHFDSLSILSFLNGEAFPVRKRIAINDLSSLKSMRLVTGKDNVSVIAHFSKGDKNGEDNVYFLNQKFSADLVTEFYNTITPLDASIKESLTFYDGTDYKEASDKDYNYFTGFKLNNKYLQLSERVDEYYSKELISWQSDLETGAVSAQKILPRKIYSFQGRTRFKNITKAMPFIYDNKLHIMVLETPLNFKKDANTYKYQQFKKETNLWRSSIVMYVLNSDGNLEKKLVYRNANYDAVPMAYQANNNNEIILYLNNNKYEKFIFLKPDQL